MKKTLLSALFIAPALSFGQVTILSENFDSYADGDWAGVVSSVMSSWDGTTGAAPDCQVTSSQSSSPSNSIEILGPNAGGTTDAMVVFPSDYTSGRYSFTMKYMVASAMGGYFNVQSSSTAGVAWITEVYFAADGSGTATAGGQSFNFTYTNGAWIDIQIDADLDADQGEIFIEGTSIGTFQWSLESGGAGTGANKSFGGLNLYSASGDPTADCEYYVDDIMLVKDNVGINEAVLTPTINVVPNPSNGNFIVAYADMNMANANVSVVDMLGSVVYTSKSGVVGNGTMSFDLNLNDGVYFVTFSEGNSKLTKRVIVRK